MSKKKITPFQSKKLRNLRDFKEILLNAIGDGLLAVDNSGVALLSQGVVRKRLKIHPGNHLSEDLPELWQKVEKTLEDRKCRIELSAPGVDSSYILWINPILVDDEMIGVICIFMGSTEIGEVNRKMKSFQNLNKELDIIIDSCSDGVLVCDADGTVIRMNPASERINNVKEDRVIGRKILELSRRGLLALPSTALEAIKTKSVVSRLQQEEGAGKRKLISTATPVFNEKGRLIRVVISERDITEIETLQRELEEQEALKDQYRHKMLAMQQADLKSRRVIAKSPPMIRALEQALKVSRVDSSVLILGESGVGKGLFADLIHKNSARSEKPMIKINCGAIPENLIEAELFGYEKGAFTGAQSGKPGHFELADGGILFLDEIADLPLPSQVKLLRFLEDGRVMRLGGTQDRAVDIRILAATNRNLEEMVEQEKFRLDLYYRLNVIPLYVPTLRERKECLRSLIGYYIEYFGKKCGLKKRLSGAATDALCSYPYPGNVRQLMNICERLVVMSDTELIDLQDLPDSIIANIEDKRLQSVGRHKEMTLQQIVEKVERSVLAEAIEKYRNQRTIASVLGVTQATIARKLMKYDIGKKYVACETNDKYGQRRLSKSDNACSRGLAMSNEYGAKTVHGEADQHFAELLKEKSRGQILITNYFGSSLGYKSKDQFSAVADGALPIANTYIGSLSGLDPMFLLPSLPFLVTTIEDAEALWHVSKPYLAKILTKGNQILLYASPWPPIGIWARKPITSMETLKNLKIRCSDMSGVLGFRELGADPLQLTWADTLPLLGSGEFEAVLTSTGGGVSSEFWEFFDHFTQINYSLTLNMVHINMTEYELLSPDLQEAVNASAEEASAAAWSGVIKSLKKDYSLLKKYGVTITTDLPPTFKSELAKARETVLQEWLKQTGDKGAEIIEEFKKRTGRK